MSTDDDVTEKWRAGCECNRVGLCYRCQAASTIGKLRAQLRQIDAVETTPHTPAEMKVGIMAALARQGLS